VARGRRREIALWRTRPGHHGISLREGPWLLEAFACLFLFSLAAGGGRGSRLVAGQAQRLLFAVAFSERPLPLVTGGEGMRLAFPPPRRGVIPKRCRDCTGFCW